VVSAFMVREAINIGFYMKKFLEEDFFSDLLPSTTFMDKEDALVFKPEVVSLLKVAAVHRTTSHPPLNILEFDGSYIILSKLSDTVRQSLSKLIHCEFRSEYNTVGESYGKYNDFSRFSLEQRSGRPRNFSSLYVTVDGDDYSDLMKNDSTWAFTIDASSISLRSGVRSPIDILLSGNEHFFTIRRKVLISSALVARKGKLYFVLMTPFGKREDFDPATLVRLLSN
jgi:hypothetical protein